MPFEKGHNKKGGRKKGVPNKTTAQMRERLSAILDGQIDKIEENLNKAEKEGYQQYLTLLEKYMSYVVPKKRDITSDDKSITPTIVIKEDRNDK